MQSLLRCLLLLCALAALPALAQPRATVRITSADLLETPGENFAPPPSHVDEHALQGRWATVALPHVLQRPVVKLDGPGGAAARATVISWFRIHLPPLAQDRASAYLPRWKSDGQMAMYVDGRLVFHSHANIDWNGWNIPLLIALHDVADAGEMHTLLIRLERPAGTGGGISSLWFGDERALSWRYHLRYFLQVQLPYTSSAAFLAVGLFSLFIWLRRRGEKVYLLFFGMSLASFLRTLHYHVGASPLPVSDEWFSWLTINSLYWMLLLIHFFLQYLHRFVMPRVNLIVAGLTLVVGLASMPLDAAGVDVYDASPLAYLVLLVFGTTLGIINARHSYRARSQDGLLLSAWALVGMAFGIYDWLLQINALDAEAIYLGPFTNIGAFLLLMFILYRRYLQAHHEVLRVNASLQTRLQEREDELRASHERLRAIALQQTLSDERQRLMQDMHDGMGSSLVTALMVVEHGAHDPAIVADVLKHCIDDLKLTIDSMEPVQSDLLLLLATFRFRMGSRLEQGGIRLRWNVRPVPALDWLDPRSALHILRILQEAFTNIIKHARATEVRVTTEADDSHVLVTIADNGIGIADLDEPRTGKGLANQRRRAAGVGGTLDMEASSAGTTVRLRLPIRRHAAADA